MFDQFDPPKEIGSYRQCVVALVVVSAVALAGCLSISYLAEFAFNYYFIP